MLNMTDKEINNLSEKCILKSTITKLDKQAFIEGCKEIIKLIKQRDLSHLTHP